MEKGAEMSIYDTFLKELEAPCAEVDFTAGGIQKLCEQLIACRCWSVLALRDRAFVYDKDNQRNNAIHIKHPSFWSFRVELFGVEVKVSKPRRLWKMIHARCKMNDAVFHARAVMEAIEQAREVIKKEVPCSDERKEEVNA
jgi:hypothetical protein